MKSLSENQTSDRIFGLDILRFLAIVLVLVAHTVKILGNNPITGFLSTMCAVWGVEIFFVLSGFLIGTIIIKLHNQSKYTTIDTIKIFWIRRWFRTLPNYYLMLFFYTLLYFYQEKTFDFYQIKYYLYFFFLQNFVPTFPHLDFFGLSWSLSVEEWFYLLFPFSLFVTQLKFPSKLSSIIITLSIFIIGPLIIRFLTALHLDWPWDEGFRKVMPLRIDSIAIGVLAAFFKFYFPKNWNNKRYLIANIGVFSVVLLMIKFKTGFIDNYNTMTDTPIGPVNTFMKTLFFTFNSLSIALFFPVAGHIKGGRTIYHKIIVTISLISYSLYLSHPLVIVIVNHFLKAYPYMNFGVIWILCIIVSYIQYNFFEKKFTSIRDHFGTLKDKVGIV